MTLKEKFDLLSSYFDGPVARDVNENLKYFAEILSKIETPVTINNNPVTDEK